MSIQHIHSYKPARKSATERERDLWAASDQYMRGEISVEKLEEVERPCAEDFKKATLGVARQRIQMRLQFFYLVVFLFLALVSADLIIFFISGSTWILTLIPAAIILTVVNYLFSNKEKRGASVKRLK